MLLLLIFRWLLLLLPSLLKRFNENFLLAAMVAALRYYYSNMIIIWSGNAVCIFNKYTYTHTHTLAHTHPNKYIFFILITFSNGNNGTKISRNTSTPFHNLSRTHTAHLQPNTWANDTHFVVILCAIVAVIIIIICCWFVGWLFGWIVVNFIRQQLCVMRLFGLCTLLNSRLMCKMKLFSFKILREDSTHLPFSFRHKLSVHCWFSRKLIIALSARQSCNRNKR